MNDGEGLLNVDGLFGAESGPEGKVLVVPLDAPPKPNPDPDPDPVAELGDWKENAPAVEGRGGSSLVLRVNGKPEEVPED